MHVLYDKEIKTGEKRIDFFFLGGDTGAHCKHITTALTKTFGRLASEVHGIQTHSALCGSHVQSHIKPVRNIVVHALLKTPVEFWRKILKNH